MLPPTFEPVGTAGDGSWLTPGGVLEEGALGGEREGVAVVTPGAGRAPPGTMFPTI